MKVWITKYALTGGIETAIAQRCTTSTDMIKVNSKYFHGEGRDWHLSLEAALIRADMMRKNKIASLRKSLKKFEVLSFQSDGEVKT